MPPIPIPATFGVVVCEKSYHENRNTDISEQFQSLSEPRSSLPEYINPPPRLSPPHANDFLPIPGSLPVERHFTLRGKYLTSVHGPYLTSMGPLSRLLRP
ncbi:hypothetical protein Hypma_004509 [Hypsizygus marmoreus]|uniref:Uncharacterized protein n=1 Tax=Hypsizygus marmoreus TaxID=39966 RepID=A0A369K6B5_HYPMA|nr:hypothetical protein Hypma_004509 [Hypsizygus marmoreus]